MNENEKSDRDLTDYYEEILKDFLDIVRPKVQEKKEELFLVEFAKSWDNY